MKLFELRACWNEYYDDPDEGAVHNGECYETIAFSIDSDARLRKIKTDLDKGFTRGWNERRSKALRKLYPGYDDLRETEYKIIELTDLVV